MENLRFICKERFRRKVYYSKEKLISVITKIEEKITENDKKLINSILNRIKTVMKAKCELTKW